MADACSRRCPDNDDHGTQTDDSCGNCSNFDHATAQCPVRGVAQSKLGHGGVSRGVGNFSSSMDNKSARYRVGGGFALGPEVPGLSEGSLDASEARFAIVSARAAGCLREDGSVVYASNHSNRRPISARLHSNRPSSAPAGGRRTRKDMAPAKLVARGQCQQGFVAKEENRAKTAGCRTPEGRPGHLVGTFNQGFHDLHRFESDRAPRTAYRVYRSKITSDAACTQPAGLAMHSIHSARDSCSYINEDLGVNVKAGCREEAIGKVSQRYDFANCKPSHHVECPDPIGAMLSQATTQHSSSPPSLMEVLSQHPKPQSRPVSPSTIASSGAHGKSSTSPSCPSLPEEPSCGEPPCSDDVLLGSAGGWYQHLASVGVEERMQHVTRSATRLQAGKKSPPNLDEQVAADDAFEWEEIGSVSPRKGEH